jgi:hypothetical protein
MFAACTAGCGGQGPSARVASQSNRGKAPASALGAKLPLIKPGALIPEIDEHVWPPRFRDNGASLYLLGGLRVALHANGRTEVAAERFGHGVIEVIELPERLGGGYVFYSSDGRGTKLWRADTWTSTLRPLAALTRATDEIIIGFDRLYLRGHYNGLVAIDPEDGRLRPLGALPPVAALGEMAFADSWRAVVDTDLRGPLATFDAGATWRALPIEAAIRGISIKDGDPLMMSDSGYYRLDHLGNLQLYSLARPDSGAADDAPARPTAPQTTPLGPRPLRMAIERGYPESTSSVVVAHRGKLVRVSLPDGRVLKSEPILWDVRRGSVMAVASEANCQGVRFGAGFGFVCGTEGGATTLHVFEEPFALREVARFAEPRFVSSSDNGWLAVRGGCAERLPPEEPTPKKKPDDKKKQQEKDKDKKPGKDNNTKDPKGTAKSGKNDKDKDKAEENKLRNYCLLDGRGQRREVGVRGELGSERVVPLRDGRTVILVPPRLGAAGRINIIAAGSVKSVEVKIPDEPPGASKIAQRGLWLEGVRETEDGALATWVEAGGRALGVTVKLDGKAELGTLYDRGGDVLFAGRYALAVPAGETAYESTDGGKSWVRFELPRLPEAPSDAKTRGCSAAGCAIRGWLRVGWAGAESDNDLRAAPEPAIVAPEIAVAPSMRLTCNLETSNDKPVDWKRPPPEMIGENAAWEAYKNVPPPQLAKGEIGIDRGTYPYSPLTAYGYAWGPKGSDWTRAGWWLVRFDDRFAALGGVRSTVKTRPPWNDVDSASDALGVRSSGYHRWHVLLDPSGRSALVSLCQQSVSQCEMFSAVEGQPLVSLRAPTFMRIPADNGAVRIGDTWFFLIDNGTAGLELWRGDANAVTMVTRYRRATGSRHQAPLPHARLVRRAEGGAIGLLVDIPADESTSGALGAWSVLPVNPDDGALGEPVHLGPSRVSSPMRACEPNEEGWLVEVKPSASTSVTPTNYWGYTDDFEYRLRIEPTGACVEAIAAHAGRSLTARTDSTWTPPKDRKPISMTASEPYGGSRWPLTCYENAPAPSFRDIRGILEGGVERDPELFIR